MPAFNEEESITGVIKGFSDVGIIDEIIIVDNNSHDQTVKLAKATKKAKIVKENKILVYNGFKNKYVPRMKMTYKESS